MLELVPVLVSSSKKRTASLVGPEGVNFAPGKLRDAAGSVSELTRGHLRDVGTAPSTAFRRSISIIMDLIVAINEAA